MSLPEAGWFPDPADATRLRWWDGRTWGSATSAPAPRPVATAERAAAARAAAPRFSVPSQVPTPSHVEPEHGWACGSGVATATIAPSGALRVGVERRFCLFGWGSLALALVAVVSDPYGVVSLLALVAAVVGVVRPRGTGVWRTVGRSAAFSAMAIAVTTLAIAAGRITGLLPA